MTRTSRIQNARHWFALVAAVLAVGSIAVIGAVSADASVVSAQATKTVVSLRTTSLGRILVDGRGRTLYLFGKDKRGKSSCTGACAAYWPPVTTTGKPAAGTGVKAALLGTSRRADGKLQVMYNHHPLYTFAVDKRAGQTNGEETSAYGGIWYVVSAAGAKVEKDDSSGTGGSSSGSGSGSSGGAGSGGYGDGSGSSSDDGSKGAY